MKLGWRFRWKNVGKDFKLLYINRGQIGRIFEKKKLNESPGAFHVIFYVSDYPNFHMDSAIQDGPINKKRFCRSKLMQKNELFN